MGASESTPENQSPTPDPPSSATQTPPSGGCPVKHDQPVDEWKSECPASGAAAKGGCPINKDGLDPRNMVCWITAEGLLHECQVLL